jgi:glycosyltransferase family protein
VLAYDDKRLLVCLPNAFQSLSHFTPGDGGYWKKHLARYRKYWYRYTLNNKTYGNAFISRVYMCFNEKDNARDYFNALKKIWDGADVVLVEGEKSRLGVGNDLFDNARTIRRILGPSAQAFSQYDNLLAEVKKLEKSALIILAMGPVATVMPCDLLEDGYRAIDLGNIDTEYEWFLRGCTQKMPIENKMVYEAGAGEGVGELNDEVYQAQIIAKVTG